MIISFINKYDKLLIDPNIMYILNFPWDTRSEDEKNIKTIQKKFKERHIGEYGTINLCIGYISYYLLHNSFPKYFLCFCGPHGSGKTNLASTIAESMGRKFAEIDALSFDIHHADEPLFINNSLHNSIFKIMHEIGTKNPVIEIKNVDRITDFSNIYQFIDLIQKRNENQNFEFDSMPLDLSEVFFVFSIEDDSNLSPLLLEKLDIVHLNGFSHKEKFRIIKDIIIPKKLKQLNINEKKIGFTDTAIKIIIEKFDQHNDHINTSERIIDSILKKALFNLKMNNDNKSIVISKKSVYDYIKNDFEIIEKPKYPNSLGICPIMDEYIKYIEILAHKTIGSVDSLNIIGDELETVTRESVELAFTLAKNIFYHISPKREDAWEFHVHIDTEYISQKDFHENTVSLTFAFLSYYLETKITEKWIYVGEVSLNGKLLPIKNIEKRLKIAKNEGFRHIFIPEIHSIELECIPKEYDDVMIYHVSWIQDIAVILFNESLNEVSIK